LSTAERMAYIHILNFEVHCAQCFGNKLKFKVGVQYRYTIFCSLENWANVLKIVTCVW